MVVPRDSSRRELREGVGGRIKELRNKLASIVAKGISVDLTTHYEHCSVWKDDAISECALIGHIANRLNSRLRWWSADCDDVRV